MATTNGSQANDDDFETIFTAFITLKNGKRILLLLRVSKPSPFAFVNASSIRQ